MRNFKEVIDLWPSTAELASDVGKEADAVRKWKERGSIPSDVWADLVAAAVKRNYPVDVQLLASLAKKPKRKSVRV